MERGSTTLEFSLSKPSGTLLDNSKFSSNSQNINDSLNSDYGARATKADEMFKNLIERVNRSKEYIESVHRSTFSSNNSEPTKDTPVTTLRAQDDKAKESEAFTKLLPSASFKQENSKQLDAQPSTRSALIEKENKRRSVRDELSDHSNDLSEECGRMSTEIHDFKQQLLEKVRRNSVKPKEEVPTPAASTQMKKTSDRLRKFDILSSEEDEEEEEEKEVKTYSHATTATKKPVVQKSSNTSVRNSNAKPVKNTPVLIDTEPKATSNPKTLKGRKPDAASTINQLKHALNDRDNLLQEKYINLKFRSKELRNTLQEYVNKCLDLEDALKLKDQQLQDLQHQNKQLQTELNKKTETSNDLVKQQEHWNKTEKALRDENKALEESEASLRRKLKELELLAQSNESKYLSQIQALQTEKQERSDGVLAKEGIIAEQKRLIEAQRIEIENLQKECEAKESRILQVEAVSSLKIQDCQRLKEQMEEMEKNNKVYVSTIEDLKEKNSQWVEKVNKLKKKLEDERNHFQEEKQMSLQSKKEKIKKLRAELKQSESFALKLSDEKKALQFEIEKQTSLNSTLEKSMMQLKGEIVNLHQLQ